MLPGRATRIGGMIVAFVVCSATTRGDDSEPRSLGRQLFEASWLKPAADDSPLAATRDGDGLGPLFNATSCAGCHRQGGVGGGGPTENNVEIVSLVLPFDANDETVKRASTLAGKVHRGFFESRDVTLHLFGRDANGLLREYESFRGLLRSSFPEQVVPAVLTQQVASNGLTFQLAQRNTPAVFGAGHIDAIPPKLVQRIAATQRNETPQIAGRPSHRGEGRFGWRGHVSSLDEFVRTACAAELGLRVQARLSKKIHDQADWPIEGPSDPTPKRLRADMSETQVEQLVAFVRSLPAPRQILPDDPEAAKEIYNGEYHFASIGCAACHIRDVGPARGLYSDLLLHDMGSMLADRVSAPLPEPKFFKQSQIRGSGGGGSYSGGSGGIRVRNEPATPRRSLGDLVRATQEFRTPPLWGVADSAPYLHDGRAATLDEAIRLHGGQGSESAKRYDELSNEEREEIVAFLGSLRAPEVK